MSSLNAQTVSNRHEGDLGGKLCSFGEVKPIPVTIVVAPERAHDPAVQHAAWMALNLLCRFDRIVERVTLQCPRDVPLCGRVVPIASRTLDLRSALLAGAEAIGVVPVGKGEPQGQSLSFGAQGRVGYGDPLYVEGNGWCGGISRAFVGTGAMGPPSALPFGPYVAACLAASEVFRSARMRLEQYPAPAAAYYSIWEHRASATPIVAGPREITVELDAVLAGAGAVGCALMHNLWACPEVFGRMVVADNDPAGLDVTNLNRYALFDRASVGCAKATEAARIAADAAVRWEPVDAPFESIVTLPPRVVSAVDRNRARHAIQNRYPARILSGSTLDLRAEVTRCGPPGVGACLRCYNEPEKIAADEELRASLRDAPAERLMELAVTSGVTLDDVREWVSTGRCGLAGERLLPHLRVEGGAGDFAVSFVSVMAGTLLAGELVKDYLPDAASLGESTSRAVFQFFSPLSKRNGAGPYPRHPACPMCSPSSIACEAWARRYSALAPRRP
jgi:molybdopterin/thiamine biosynthesis adenylyltransferase